MARRLLVVLAVAASAFAAACGTEGIDVAKSDPDYEGAKIFEQRCSGCHTLQAAGTQGSAVSANSREGMDGPNFNQRAETKEQVLYALRNGGFSGAIMPQNIVVGDDADAVARFLDEYSGTEATTSLSPSGGE